MSYLTSADARPCIQCEHWAGPTPSGSHCVCERGPRPMVQADPKWGCAFWVRAVGADDEPQKEKTVFILDSQDKEKQAAIRLFAAVRAVSRFDAVGIKPYCYRIAVPVERIDAVNAVINAMPDANLWNDVVVVSEETEAQLALERRRNEGLETGALQRFRTHQKPI